jgi:DNA-binding MarR family transcriptional regulator
VRRVQDPDDARVVRVMLTGAGDKALATLSELHLEELSRLASHLQPLLRGLDIEQGDRGGSRSSG